MMTEAKLRLNLYGKPSEYQVTLYHEDGVLDISRMVKAVHYSVEAGDMPSVVLEIVDPNLELYAEIPGTGATLVYPGNPDEESVL